MIGIILQICGVIFIILIILILGFALGASITGKNDKQDM